MTDAHDRVRTPFGFASTAADVLDGVDLSARTVLVTGTNSGIGFETARAVAAAGARLILAARDEDKANEAARRIVALTGNASTVALPLDLADLESVTRAVGSVTEPIDVLVNNAGVMAIPELTRTRQGHEMQFSVNFLGHFALTLGLHDALAAAGAARVVCVSSNAHLYSPVVFGDVDFRFRRYEPIEAYAQAKTACVLLGVAITRRWGQQGILANALNPGAIATGLQRHTGGIKTPVERRKTVEQGAATSALLAASPLVEGIGGRYFEDVNEAAVRHESPGPFGTGVADYALDSRYAELLWETATEMVTARPRAQ
ncbi:SDR family NAD(P)-dependent oxidoreductase [Mycolicibacterium palauense]|uniref:SDR family NAD(P)-dependent oxidoreductase n=1 Tax=Mycolicibacterium palauense TaxID=2034511 RepID=UPI000BFEC049|nr:SDR family NAD(P)-dependent oxidoreductase [Mycolicibacterium palauense]